MAATYDIVIAQEPWDRFWAYVDECPDEVAAFGYVKADEEISAFYVDEIFLVPQEVCGTEVDFIKDGLPYAVEKAIEDGRVEDLRFCVHSHVNMGTTFSATDEDMIRKMGSTGTPWFASAVFNKKGETNGRVDIFECALPFDASFGVSQFSVKANVMTEHSRLIVDSAKSELAKFVKKQDKPVTPTSGHGGTGNWRKPTKDTAGQSLSHAPKQLGSGDDTGTNWWEEGLEEELELWIRARRELWEPIEDTDGKVHFFDSSGEYKGTADDWMDESTIDWFVSRGWADGFDDIPLVDDTHAAEVEGDIPANRETTP